MIRVYRNPADAIRHFETDTQLRSVETAVKTLMTAPEAYGTLRAAERSGITALFRDRDETAARLSAHDAAIHAVTTHQRRTEIADVPQQRVGLQDATRRMDTAAAQLSALPTETRMERSLRVMTRDMTAEEHRAVATQLTDTQRYLMQSLGISIQNVVRQTAQDIALGREGRER
jgi:hypothetical protein